MYLGPPVDFLTRCSSFSFSSDRPMWQTIDAVRNMDCSSDDAKSDSVTFKSISLDGDPELLGKIHYEALLNMVSTGCSKSPLVNFFIIKKLLSQIIPHYYPRFC